MITLSMAIKKRFLKAMYIIMLISLLLSPIPFAPYAMLQVEARTTVSIVTVDERAEQLTCGEAQLSISVKNEKNSEWERDPVDVVFVIDRSSSMKASGTDYLAKVKTAVGSFVDKMDFEGANKDRVAIVSYAGYSSDAASIDYHFGSDPAAAKASLSSIVAKGGTCMECGLRAAYDMLGYSDRKQFVVLLSDGVANIKYPGTGTPNVCNFNTSEMDCPLTSTQCMDYAVNWGVKIKNSADTELFTVAYRLDDIDAQCSNSGQTADLAKNELIQIATDHEHYYAGDPDNIDMVFREIAQEIENISISGVKIFEELPDGIFFKEMIMGNEPVLSNGQLAWDIGEVDDDETKEIKFIVSAEQDYDGLLSAKEERRVEYYDYENSLNEVMLPEISVRISECLPIAGEIRGCVWEDDGDGIRQETEKGLGDWQIELRDGNGTALASTSTETEDGGTCYKFSNLPIGDYIVTQVVPSDWEQVYPKREDGGADIHAVTLTEEDLFADSVDFGNKKKDVIPSAPYCGNGLVENDETCDDGNLESGDACSAICTVEEASTGAVCGNGKVEEGETCDDGNTAPGDTCSEICVTEQGEHSAMCGNGTLEADEACDDGNAIANDGCSADCIIEQSSSESAVCGNDVVEAGESCDDGNDNGKPGFCDGSCTYTVSSGSSHGQGIMAFPYWMNRQVGSASSTPDMGNLAELPAVNEEEPVVLGESGAPILSLTNRVDQTVSYPGELLNYSLRISNTGTIDAFNVVVEDTLPEGWDTGTGKNQQIWEIGDLSVGDSKEMKFQVTVPMDVVPAKYSNFAIARADNHSDVRSESYTEVKSAVLAATGLKTIELIAFPGAMAMVYFATSSLRKKQK